MKSPPELWYNELSRKYLEALTTHDCLILDVGSGVGYSIQSLPSDRNYVFGDLDVRPELRGAAVHLRNAGLVKLDGQSLPFRDETFCVVMTHQVIEHVVAPRSFVREIQRVARRSGLVIVSSVIRGKLGAGRYVNRYGARVMSPDHLSEFASRKEFLDLFKDTDLIPIRVVVRPTRITLGRFLPRRFAEREVGFVSRIGVPLFLYYSFVIGFFAKPGGSVHNWQERR